MSGDSKYFPRTLIRALEASMPSLKCWNDGRPLGLAHGTLRWDDDMDVLEKTQVG